MTKESTAARVRPHLAEPADTSTLRGSKKRAKTDRADARLQRELLYEHRVPESWIPPEQVLEIRTLGRVYCALMDERHGWQQGIHAQLFHQGCAPVQALLTESGRGSLAEAELSPAGRQYVDTALAAIDALIDQIDSLWAQLVAFAARQPGCRALPARHYGVGSLCATLIWAELGDARRFHDSDQVVRFAGLDVTVYSAKVNARPAASRVNARPSCGGRCLKPPRAPPTGGRRTMLTTAAWPPNAAANSPRWQWPANSYAAVITGCATSATPRSPPPTDGRSLPDDPRACPAHDSADARGRLPLRSCHHRVHRGGRPGKNELPRHIALSSPSPHHAAALPGSRSFVLPALRALHLDPEAATTTP